MSKKLEAAQGSRAYRLHADAAAEREESGAGVNMPE